MRQKVVATWRQQKGSAGVSKRDLPRGTRRAEKALPSKRLELLSVLADDARFRALSSSSALLLIVATLNHADGRGSWWIGSRTWAYEVGVGRATVWRGIAECCATEPPLLHKQAHARRNGRQAASTYWLDPVLVGRVYHADATPPDAYADATPSDADKPEPESFVTRWVTDVTHPPAQEVSHNAAAARYPAAETPRTELQNGESEQGRPFVADEIDGEVLEEVEQEPKVCDDCNREGAAFFPEHGATLCPPCMFKRRGLVPSMEDA